MSKFNSILIAIVVLTLTCTNACYSITPSFQGLGDLSGGRFSSDAEAVSADGSTVVGISEAGSGKYAFRWTADSGMQNLGDIAAGANYSIAHAVTADGSVVVGRSTAGFRDEAFRWDIGYGKIKLLKTDIEVATYPISANAISSDGSVIAGVGRIDDVLVSFRWTATDIVDGIPVGDMVSLGGLPGGRIGMYANVGDMSADGSVIVGGAESSIGNEAYRWTVDTGMVGLGDLPGGNDSSYATGISSDGSVVIGASYSDLGREAFRWTEQEGMVSLGQFPGGSKYTEAYAVSADGSVIVGSGQGMGGTYDYHAFIWTEQQGLRLLEDVLIDDYGIDLTGWSIQSATGISANGMTIVGSGINPNGDREAFIAIIPEPGSLVCLSVTLTLLKRSR